MRENDENVDEEVERKNVTERLAMKREAKFNQLWNELLEKISEINQVEIPILSNVRSTSPRH